MLAQVYGDNAIKETAVYKQQPTIILWKNF